MELVMAKVVFGIFDGYQAWLVAVTNTGNAWTYCQVCLLARRVLPVE